VPQPVLRSLHVGCVGWLRERRVGGLVPGIEWPCGWACISQVPEHKNLSPLSVITRAHGQGGETVRWGVPCVPIERVEASPRQGLVRRGSSGRKLIIDRVGASSKAISCYSRHAGVGLELRGGVVRATGGP
jgi:hypothetical protein